KYFNIHWEGLVNNLGGDSQIAAQAVNAFIESAAISQPSGKQNSTAAFQLPDLMLVEVGDRNLPINYANAFLKPIQQTRRQTLMENSIEELDKYSQKIRDAYGIDSRRAFFTVTDNKINNAENLKSLADLQNWVASQIAEVADV
ncbi:MAG TPA: hypothetical protein EYP74_01230, partial [Anaerolineales bacterium]|nr:hypothetical protein [Anaerolineales bacterium]